MTRIVFLALLTSVTASTASAQEEGGAFRVTNGTEVPAGMWEDTAGVVFNGSYVGCTGTLVAPDVVLTAAHCTGGISHVVLGTNDWRSDDAEVIRVSDVAVSRQADIAALKLAEPSTVEPRPVGFGCVIDEYLEDGAPVAIVGYGTTDSWGREGTTRMIEGYTEVTDHDCSATSRGCQRDISPGGEIGAGGANGDGVDACFGDSGGPLYLLTEAGDFLVGVTSRAFNDVNPPCGLGGIWVRPDAFVDWIEDEMDVVLPEPTCTMMPVASDDRMTVPTGRSRSTKIKVEDVDSDVFTFTVGQAPEHGTISIDDDGTVTYTADDGYLGLDTFAVTVTDTSGFPLGSDLAVIEVEVVERSFLGCACNSPSAPVGAVWMVGLLGLFVRRRQNLSA